MVSHRKGSGGERERLRVRRGYFWEGVVVREGWVGAREGTLG